MSTIEQKFREQGLEPNMAPQPLANYVRMQRDGQTIYLSGASAIKDGKPMVSVFGGEDMQKGFLYVGILYGVLYALCHLVVFWGTEYLTEAGGESSVEKCSKRR